ncbi:MAG TPA: M1 family aminopeptidase [Blastocatellia bacterium]|nr:M1 family aminopeptidase [Blastocatellia bacterium]
MKTPRCNRDSFSFLLPRLIGRLKLACVVAAAILLSTPALATLAQAPAPQAPPVQWPRSHDYDVQHYRIEVSFAWGDKTSSGQVTGTVFGQTTITLRLFRSDPKEIEVDAGNMQISSVKLEGGAPLKFRYEDKEHLYIAPDRSYPAGAELRVVIAYKATPERGLTFIQPTAEDPSRPYQIWSQGESQDNHYWFPCYDYPNDKATTELIAHVEDGYQVISNGVLVGSAPDPERKTRTWHWKMDKPYSSYLVSVIVGKFAEVRDQVKGVPVISYVYASEVENARLSFAKLGQMVAFYSERVGVDFPYAKYAQTTVRDFGGGMENITATTLTDTSVHDKRAHLDVSSDGLIAHELAHSWFGDLLTCRDWSELWLNESFATFMEATWTEHDLGRPDYLYEMYNNQQAALGAWTQENRRPIVGRRYTNPDALFDVYPYPRGGAVINMLRYVLGDDLFWRAINHYVKKHAYQNVETQDLVIAIEEATGQNLQWFFDEWLYKMGQPEFEVTSTYDEAAKAVKLAVKQTQKPDTARPWFQSPEFFTMPVDIAITTASGEHVHRVWIDAKEKTFTLDVDAKPLIVNFDRANVWIKQVKFQRTDEELAYQLLHDADVMGRVRAAVELRTHNTTPVINALSNAAANDRFWAVRLESVRSLAALKGDAAQLALSGRIKDADSRIRREAIRALGQYKDARFADAFIQVIKSDPSYFVVAEAARALGDTRSPKAYEILAAALQTPSWQDTILAGALGGLAALKDPRAIDMALKYAAPGNRPSVRGAAIQALTQAAKDNPRAFQALAAGLKDRSLEVIFNTIEALSTLGDPRAIPLLEDLAKHPPTGIPSGALNQIINEAINHIKNPGKAGEDEKKN